MECAVMVDEKFAALYRFRDTPRREGAAFVQHLSPKHRFEKIMLVSGDRESEVRYLAGQVGIRTSLPAKPRTETCDRAEGNRTRPDHFSSATASTTRPP